VPFWITIVWPDLRLLTAFCRATSVLTQMALALGLGGTPSAGARVVGSLVEDGRGVAVAVGLGVGVRVGVPLGVGVAVGLGVAVTVGRGVGVDVGAGVAVAVGRGVAVGLGLGFVPVIVLVGETLPAAAHRTYHVFFGCAYRNRAWPFAVVFFDIQTANGPIIAAAFCTDTFCDETALPLLFLTVQAITE